MTNQRYLKSLEMVDMLDAMDRNLKDGYNGCILDAIVGDRLGCPEGITCPECIENWLKAEKEEEDT